MGASVTAYWRGISDQQYETMPGFRNDDRAWANWMAQREENVGVDSAVRALGADALLTVKTDGWDDDDVDWITPAALRNAASAVRHAIAASSPHADVILQSYAPGANRIDPVEDELNRDLEDIEALAAWAEAQGARQMTLEVNW